MKLITHIDGSISVVGFVGRCPLCQQLVLNADGNVLYRSGENVALGWSSDKVSHHSMRHSPTSREGQECRSAVRPLLLEDQVPHIAAHMLGGNEALWAMGVWV